MKTASKNSLLVLRKTEKSTRKHRFSKLRAVLKTGVDPMSTESSSMGISDSRNPTFADATTETKTTLTSANATMGETSSNVQTADEGLPTGTLYASSTRRKVMFVVETAYDWVKSACVVAAAWHDLSPLKTPFHMSKFASRTLDASLYRENWHH